MSDERSDDERRDAGRDDAGTREGGSLPGAQRAGEPSRPRRRRDLHEVVEIVEDAAIEAERETGRREETVEEAKRNVLLRAGRIALGTLVTLAGLALLVLPGPGLVVVAIGLAILAQDVPFAERLLERVRARLPADAEGNVPKSVVFGGAAATVLALAASAWWTFGR